jgi:PPOX class probable F420-dependent enzyme
MAHKMTDDEWRAFASEGTRTGKLSTVRADGRPHLAPVWFVLDGDDLVFNTGKETVKGRNLARDPRVSLCVDDERPPYAFVVCEGTATISEDPDELLKWAIRIGGRYMGADRGEEFGRRNAVPGELLVRVHVDKVVALAELAE